jgi:hypothetical protein
VSVVSSVSRQPIVSQNSASPATLIMSRRPAPRQLNIPFLDINGYYSFLSTAMIVLFAVALVIIFVYEYEALRRSKT